MNNILTNGDVMSILEDIAKEWAINKPDIEIDAVVSYLNDVCYKWMGGDLGLHKKHIKQ